LFWQQDICHDDSRLGFDRDYFMITVATVLVLVPGAVALLVFLVFTYLYEQSRQSYFRTWQFAWAAYTWHVVLEAVAYFKGPSPLLFVLASILLLAMAMYIFISTRLMKSRYQFKWYDAALYLAGLVLIYVNLRARMAGGVFNDVSILPPYYRFEVGLAAILLYAPVTTICTPTVRTLPLSSYWQFRWHCGRR